MAPVSNSQNVQNLHPAMAHFLQGIRYKVLPLLHYLPLVLIFAFVLYMPSPRLGTDLTKMELQAMGDVNKRIIFSLAFLIAFIGIIRKPGALKHYLMEPRLLLVLLIYALLTVLWASSTIVAFKRWMQFAGFLLVVWCALLPEGSPGRILNILRFLFTTALVLSLIYSLLGKANSIEITTGAWRGIFSHKNILGQVSAITLILWFPTFSSLNSWKVWLLGLLSSVMALFLLLKSDSATAFVIFALVFLGWVIFYLPFRREIKYFLVPVPFLIFLFWITNFQKTGIDEMFFNTLNRDTSFTGRTVLWEAFLENTGSHTLFGSGYNSFWISTNKTAQNLIQQLGWDPGQAHNGYLDILNELGLIGGVLFGLFLLQALIRTRRYQNIDREVGTVLFFIMLSQILYNYVETSFCRSSSLGWLATLVSAVIASHVLNRQKKAGENEN
ncbi:MAG: O-antigen ligase family protein [Calditrichaeota bacterium]|nr:MAG: O-antigen ligase family protein [Calditrichota bacterium]